jgi:RNA-directed DNA polymerase
MQLTIEEAAARLGKSPRQVRYLIQTNRLAARKFGGSWVIESENLPLSEGQTQALERRERQLRSAVEQALDLPAESERAPRWANVRVGVFLGENQMRSVPAGSFDRLSRLEALWRAWLLCRRGKRRQPRIADFDLDADHHVCQLHRNLRSSSYVPGSYRLQIVHDPKTRLVAAPQLRDRIVQTALLNEIGPTYESSFIDQSYACCAGRGPLRAVLAYLAFTRRFRFRISLDVRRYFASIHHEILLGLFSRRLRDARTLGLLAAMLQAGGKVYRSPLAVEALNLASDPVPAGCGLPLGSYLSHWSGGLYLDGLDHHVKRSLGVAGYLRYMDDIVLFSDDSPSLQQARESIRSWLREERRLDLKARRDGVQPTTQPSTYLGFRVSRAGVLPGPKAKMRLKQRLAAADSMKGETLQRCLTSYRGLLLSI